MLFEIKSRWDGSVLFSLECGSLKLCVEAAVNAGANLADAYLARAYLAGANLAGAYLARANLAGAYLADAYLARANLAGAYLAGANLAGAYLARANLARANLARAYLARAYLAGAKGINKYRMTPLYSLLEQPGPIRMYKLVDANGVGPFNGGITYEVGKTYEVANANTDETTQCGAGINLADLPWCMSQWCAGRRILIAEFAAADIAAIPIGSDGKFRVHRCRIVGEKDLTELGLVKLEAVEAAHAD